jgi:predicted secreted hydrolase
MHAAGSVRLADDAPIDVTGTAWLDREWATSSLDEDVEGWDWFSLQLDDGTNLMLYRLRNTDGSMNEFSTGTLMHPDGTTRRLAADAVQYDVAEQWQSPTSRVRYPVAWQITIPELDLTLRVTARIQNQEFNLGLRYWEGAVSVTGTKSSDNVAGVGYLELAGYQ